MFRRAEPLEQSEIRRKCSSVPLSFQGVGEIVTDFELPPAVSTPVVRSHHGSAR